MTVYHADFCEREYNARAAIPDHPQIFARWAQQAAASRRLRACVLDVAYGDRARDKFDLFPARQDGVPLIVYFHGGYWRSLDKSDFSWIAPPYVAHGISMALVNYAFVPGAALEDIVRQCLRALTWLYRHADRYGFDPTRIYVAGHSAGAHLAAMTMAAHWPQWASDLPTCLVKGGVLVSGLYDLEPLRHAPFINSDIKLTSERAARLSPAWMPPAARAVVTAVGALESAEFRRQTGLIERHWKPQWQKHVTVARANHMTVVDDMADSTHPLFHAVLEMIGR